MSTILHHSLISHLSIELDILRSLRQRSSNQHRLQIFYRRMTQVFRLATALRIELAQGIFQVQLMEKIVRKLVPGLFLASEATSQIIELRHFLPLQIPLVGIYARLFAIISNIGKAYNLSMDSMLTEHRARTPRPRRALAVVPVDNHHAVDHDIGQVVLRVDELASEPSAASDAAQSRRLLAEAQPDVVPLANEKVERRNKKKKKLRRKGSIDDIFGF